MMTWNPLALRLNEKTHGEARTNIIYDSNHHQRIHLNVFVSSAKHR